MLCTRILLAISSSVLITTLYILESLNILISGSKKAPRIWWGGIKEFPKVSLITDESRVNWSLSASEIQTLNHETPVSAKALFQTKIDG